MIRKANKQDIPAIEALLLQVLQVHHEGRPDIFKPIGQKYTTEELEAILADETKPTFVYEDEQGKVIGHCFCQIIDRQERPCTYAYKSLFIDDLCIDENERGKHVGKALYEYVKAYAKERNFHDVLLHAWECNPDAVGFYEHLGMKVREYSMEEIL